MEKKLILTRRGITQGAAASKRDRQSYPSEPMGMTIVKQWQIGFVHAVNIYYIRGKVIKLN